MAQPDKSQVTQYGARTLHNTYYFPLQQYLRESASMLRNTSTVSCKYLHKPFKCILSHPYSVQSAVTTVEECTHSARFKVLTAVLLYDASLLGRHDLPVDVTLNPR